MTPLWVTDRMSTHPKAQRDQNAESASPLTASVSQLRFSTRLWWTRWRTVSTGKVTQTPGQEFCQSRGQKPHLNIVQQQNYIGGYCYATVGTVDLPQGCLKFFCKPRCHLRLQKSGFGTSGIVLSQDPPPSWQLPHQSPLTNTWWTSPLMYGLDPTSPHTGPVPFPKAEGFYINTYGAWLYPLKLYTVF